MMARLNQEEGRYRVLLIGIGDNTEEQKESFSHHVSQTYNIPFPLLKKIVDRCPIILKKNLPFKKAEILAKTLKSFGAKVLVEERRNFPPVSLEFQELVPYRLALESAYFRKTQRGIWSIIGRARNISDETISDAWALVQLFDDLEEFVAFEETPFAINPLPPGEISPFKVIFEGDLFVGRGSVAFKSASGEPIPAVDERKKKEWVEVEIEDEGAFSPSWIPTGVEEKFQSIELPESPEKTVAGNEKDIPSEPLPSEQEGVLSLLSAGELRIEEEGDTEDIPQETHSLPLELPEVISESCSSLPEVNCNVEAASDGVIGDEAASPEQFNETIEEKGVSDESERPSDEEVPEASRVDASVFEEATQLLEDISEGPGESVAAVEETGKRAEEWTPSFSWIDYFKDAVQTFYQKPRDIFSIWFEECRKEGEFKDSLHALLTILVHSRFDQGSQFIKALENTQRVFRLIVQPNLPLDEIPPLEETPFLSGEVWRRLFHRALPKVQQIGKTILERSTWKGFELERLIQVIPHMGHQNSRTAIRWFKELIPHILEIDFSDTPVTVGESLYRVASRLGIVDPHFDHYRGRNSMADVKIQSFAKMAYPPNPLEVEEPMAWMGRTEERGGHCFPVQPRCEGCLFETFCSKLYLHFNPSEKGMKE